MSPVKETASDFPLFWRAAKLTVYTLCVYILMEWLFFATKPSFLDSYPLYEQLLSLGSLPLLFLPFVAGAFLLSSLAYFFIERSLGRRWIFVLAMVPAGIAAALTLLLLDNFANTIFGHGVRKLSQPYTYVVLVALFSIVIIWCKWFAKKLEVIKDGAPGLIVALLATSAFCILLTFVLSEDLVDDSEYIGKDDSFPNVIFFSADGVQASHLPTYGYQRDTAPHLDQMAKSSMVVYNAVANAGRTTGSTTALLTGKYASTTKVIFPPHVLHGRHIFQHLPGLLKKHGYKSIQEAVRYYADGGDLNMAGAFDVANGRSLAETAETIPENMFYKFYAITVLIQNIRERLEDRLLHLLAVKSMSNAFDSVNPDGGLAKVYGTSDQTRVDRALDFIRQNDSPVFAFVHLMDTHCCTPLPSIRKYSQSHKKPTNHNFVDFYDDSILESDLLFGKFIDELKRIGEYEDSLIVYSSDHTRGWRTNKSVPLIIKFPNGEHAGNRYGANQLLDVAPTVADYFRIPIPDWMEGLSYLSNEPDHHRHLFTLDSVNRERFRSKTDSLSRLVGSGPPRYGVEVATLVACGHNYYLNIVDGQFVRQPYTFQGEGCTEYLEDKKAKALIEKHLQDRGFTLPYF